MNIFSKPILFVFFLVVLFGGLSTISADEKDSNLPNHLQRISVTVSSDRTEGSGVLITRRIGNDVIAFIWTAGHVVDDLRTTRSVIDKNGVVRRMVTFDDAHIVKELIEDGRKVGEIRIGAKVIKYSDFQHGDDLALLMVRKKNFTDANADFFLEQENVELGTRLYHVGSLRGILGANSMTAGIMSHVGRIYEGKTYDQTTVTAFPGSSGGGVFLAEGDHEGEYVGMLVRSAGPQFNLIVPIRRMIKWAIKNDVAWALDSRVKMPTLNEIENMNVEDGWRK